MIGTVPREGCDHPVFATMDRLDGIETFFVYARPERDPDDAALAAWHDALRRDLSGRCREAAGPLVTWNAQATRLVFAHVDEPRAVLATICGRAADYPIEVNQIVLRRGAMAASGRIVDAAPDPRDDRSPDAVPQANDDIWQATFGPEPPRLPSVAADVGFLTLTNTAGDVVTETRLTAPFHPDVRICGYLGSVDTLDPGEDDDRARELAAAVHEALDRHWPAGVPLPALINRDRNADRLDPIAWGGRRGWAFAVRREPKATVQPLVDAVRVRENELLDAMVDVALSRGLAPAVNWERASQVHIFNLWEPA